jgi:hypothetical protein
VFVYLGQYSFLSISILILLFPHPPHFTVGCIIYSITWSKGRKEALHTKNEGRVVGLFHILHRNCLLKHVTEKKEGWEDEEEDVGSYRMILRKREDNGN